MATEFEAAVRAWVLLATGLDGGAVIFAHPGGPRPSVRPYLTIRVLSSGGIVGATDHAEMTDEEVDGEPVHRTTGMRRATVSVQAIGTGAAELLEGLSLARSRPDLLEADLDVEVTSTGAVRDLTAVLGVDVEERAGVDLDVSYVTRAEYAPGVVESITATLDLEGITVTAEVP